MDVESRFDFLDVGAHEEIVEDTVGYICTICCLDFGEFGGIAQVRAHLDSKKHRRRLKRRQAGLISYTFDTILLESGVTRVLSIGDCHGGRCLSLFSGLLRSRYYGGSIFSWVSERRLVPPLTDVLGRDLKLIKNTCLKQKKKLVVVFSYGEIDVRCHSSKWKCALILARQYVAKVQQYVQAFSDTPGNEDIRVFPLLLAVPPASDQGHNPKAPFRGTLEERVIATNQLNDALEQVCHDPSFLNPVQVGFTGKETWDFATVCKQNLSSRASTSTNHGSLRIPGSLNPALSDGHVHVRSELCGPVHERVRQKILKMLSPI